MKTFALSVAAALLLIGRAHATERRFKPISWEGITFQVPATWIVTPKDDSLSADNPSGSESVQIEHFVPAPHYLAKNPTPDDILKSEIEHLASPDPAQPESFTVKPYRRFNLPCGEPAAVTVVGLGDDEYVVEYAVTSTNSLYRIHFYQSGDPRDQLGFYESLISTARTSDFSGHCKAEV